MKRAAMGWLLACLVVCGTVGAGENGEKAPADDKKAVAESGAEAEPTAEEGVDAPGVGGMASDDEADKELTAFDEFMIKMEKGGTTMIVLLILSIAGVTFALERSYNLTKTKVAPDGFADKADELWRDGKFDDVSALCKQNKSALSKVIAVIVEHRKNDISDLQVIAMDQGSREMRLHLQRAYPLAVVATLSPLLGLLGTVVGMIEAFDTIAAMGDNANPAAFADSIAKALVTTAGGLVVAVPALAFYHFFKSRTQMYAVMLEEEISEILSLWFRKRINSETTADMTAQATTSTDASSEAKDSNEGDSNAS